MADKDAKSIGFEALKNAVAEAAEKDYSDLELPPDFVERIYEIAWARRGERSDEVSPRFVTELERYLGEIFPDEDSEKS